MNYDMSGWGLDPNKGTTIVKERDYIGLIAPAESKSGLTFFTPALSFWLFLLKIRPWFKFALKYHISENIIQSNLYYIISAVEVNVRDWIDEKYRISETDI